MATTESIEIVRLVDGFSDPSIRRRFLEAVRDLRDLYQGLGVAASPMEEPPRIVSLVPRQTRPNNGPQLALPMPASQPGTLHFLRGPRKGPRRAPREKPAREEDA